MAEPSPLPSLSISTASAPETSAAEAEQPLSPRRRRGTAITSKGKEVPLSYCGTTLDEEDNADPLVPFLAPFTAAESTIDGLSNTAWRSLTSKVCLGPGHFKQNEE